MKELDAKDYGYFTISKDSYRTEEEFWKAVSDALRVLTDNDNQVLLEYDDCGNYLVQYIKPKFGAGKFVMVTEEDEWEDEDSGAEEEAYETEHIGYEDTEEQNSYFEE